MSRGDQHTETALVKARRDSYTLLGTKLRALCRVLWLSGPLPPWEKRTCKSAQTWVSAVGSAAACLMTAQDRGERGMKGLCLCRPEEAYQVQSGEASQIGGNW